MSDKKQPINWTSVAEDQIRKAQEAGEFDHLPGIDEPYDENWWVKEKLRREQISALPPALEIARDKEWTLAAIAKLNSEAAILRELAAQNERIRRAHFSCGWGPSSTTVPVDVEEYVQAWKGTK